MLGDQVLDLFLHFRIKPVPRDAHVGEFGFALRRWNHMGTQGRVPRRYRLVAAVAVPQAITHGELALAVFRRQQLVAGCEIGNIGKQGAVEPCAGFRIDLGVQGLQLAEAFGKGDLLVGGEGLAAAKYQHGIAVHGGVYGVRNRRCNGFGDVYAAALGSEQGMQRGKVGRTVHGRLHHVCRSDAAVGHRSSSNSIQCRTGRVAALCRCD